MPPPSIDLSPVSVLCVDDDPVMRTIVRAALRQRGCRDIVQAKDGEEALDLCTGRRFDLIICDLHMQPMDGRVFLRELGARGLGGGRPVVMLSADNDAGVVAEAQTIGISAWLAKPISARKLIEQIAVVLGLADAVSDPGEADSAGLTERQIGKLLADASSLQTLLAQIPHRDAERLAAWHGVRRHLTCMAEDAGAMSYGLAAELAGRGAGLLQAAEDAPAAAARRAAEIREALNSVATAIRRVVENRIAGDGGETGQRLLSRLDQFLAPLRQALH